MLRPTSVPADTEELEELRRTSTELREVVRYMKRERDLLEAKQSVTEGDVRYVTFCDSVRDTMLECYFFIKSVFSQPTASLPLTFSSLFSLFLPLLS